MVIFFSSVHLVYFNQLFCFSASKLFLIWTNQIIYWKNTLYRCWTSRSCT